NISMQCNVRMEMVALQHIFYTPIKSLDHTIRLRVHRWAKTMFYIKLCTQAVEFMFPSGCTFSQAQKTVCKFLAIVCKYSMNSHGAYSVK
ncbi:hypothetical protein SSYM_0323, partial [Serratia symbiotica str. Tucson]